MIKMTKNVRKQPRDAQGRFLSFSTKTNTKDNKPGNKTKKRRTSVSNTKVPATADKTKEIIEVLGRKTSTGKTSNTKTTTNKSTKVITIHNVHLLDASQSMNSLGKYDSALQGINAEQNKLKRSRSTKVRYTQTVYEFKGNGWPAIYDRMRAVSVLSLKSHCIRKDIKNTTPIIGHGASGNTPLNEAVGKVIEYFMKNKDKEDKVILTIFTDGEENSSSGKYHTGSELKYLIGKAEKQGFTITFMGTERDTNNVIRDLGINQSNTVIHENTSASIGSTYALRSRSLTSYTKNVEKGKSVTMGFFSSEK